MDIRTAEKLAHSLMAEHGLIQNGWQFRWDAAKVRFGQCNYRKRTIKLSRKLSAINEEVEVRDTILHEIAHALVGGGHGHDIHWKAQCIKVGARPERCYDSRKIATIRGSYVATCPGCHKEHTRFKIPRRGRAIACGACCDRYNLGKFTNQFRLDWKRVEHVHPAVTPVLIVEPATPAPGVITFSAEEAVRLYCGGMRVVDIAVKLGYVRGQGQNRVRAALIKAGAYVATPVDYKGSN